MKRLALSKTVLLLLSVLLMACEAESPDIPSAPRPGDSPQTPTGQIEIVVTVSNPNPLVNSTSTITATVTQGGQPVTNGTGVEFSTDLGTFTDNNGTSLLRITNGGVATATLTSATPGRANVIVRVGAATRTVAITFQAGPIVPPTPDTDPKITSINPTKGTPAGGEVVVITGSNFQQPVRVLFGDTPANVISVTSTEIRVVTPAAQLDVGGGEQRREVTVTVINQAGTADERSATAPQKFAYELAILTPFVFNVSPSSGPNEGNTRITIFGSGFQPPTRVYFGTGGGGAGPLDNETELEVLQIFFDRIIAVTPPALGLGNPLRDQQVFIRVLNVLSNLSGTLGRAYRYGPSMEITSVTPTSGTALGGTRLTITGWGFDDPVTVSVAGVAAQPVEVSGTKIVAITGSLLIPCASTAGEIVVHNVEDDASDVYGDDADEEDFNYIGTLPSIVAISPNPALPGQAVTITVRNAGLGTIRFQIGPNTLLPTPAQASNPTGDSPFTVTLPSTFTFTTEPCVDASGRAGVRFVPTLLNVTFNNITTGCSDTLANGLTVNPTDLSCRVPPEAVTPTATVTFEGPCGGQSADEPFLVSNAGGSDLNITGIASSIPNFQVISPTLPVTLAPGASVTFTLRVNPLPATSPTTPTTGTIQVTSNDPTPPQPTPATVTCAGPEAVTPTTTVAFTGTCGGPSTPDQPYLVSNVGGADLVITNVTSTLANFQVISPAVPVTVAPGGSVTFMLRINPLPAAPPATPTPGTISITSNDPTPPTPTPATVTCTP